MSMNTTLSKVFAFVTGVAVGSFVTLKVVKTYYERIAQEEIDSVKEAYGRRLDQAETDLEDAQDQIDDYEAELKANDYIAAMTGEVSRMPEPTDAVEKERKPYIISPDLVLDSEYEMETLFYWADGVLTDDDNNIIEDVDDVVGNGFEYHFGEYEDDSVHVRNEKYKTDYEILREERKFADVNKKPHRAEAE
jgi:hypothetical protein